MENPRGPTAGFREGYILPDKKPEVQDQEAGSGDESDGDGEEDAAGFLDVEEMNSSSEAPWVNQAAGPSRRKGNI